MNCVVRRVRRLFHLLPSHFPCNTVHAFLLAASNEVEILDVKATKQVLLTVHLQRCKKALTFSLIDSKPTKASISRQSLTRFRSRRRRTRTTHQSHRGPQRKA